MGALGLEMAATVLLFAVASFLLVAHVFVFNDWADAAQGLTPGPLNPRASESVPGARSLLLFSLVLLGAGLLLFLFLSTQTLLLAGTIAVLGMVYSHPWLNGKGRPVISSLIHFLGGLLHFLLGYSLFAAVDQRSVFLGLFFALTFTAGHLNQEVRDFDYDRGNRVRTNAVFFGARLTFFAGLSLFTLCYAYLASLAWSGILPRPLVLLAALFLPLHLYWSVQTLRTGLTPAGIRAFQARYRALYALIGLSMVGALVRDWFPR